MRAALVRVDVVGEREDGLLVGGVPLQRDLDSALVGVALEEHDLLLDRVLVLVQERDEVLDAALVVEARLAVALAALVLDADPQPAGQERGLAQALLERREVEVQRLEDLGVRQERDRRARVLGRLALLPGRPCGTPRTKSCVHLKPSRRTSTWSCSDSALTTETPTPCRPPETL